MQSHAFDEVQDVRTIISQQLVATVILVKFHDHIAIFVHEVVLLVVNFSMAVIQLVLAHQCDQYVVLCLHEFVLCLVEVDLAHYQNNRTVQDVIQNGKIVIVVRTGEGRRTKDPGLKFKLLKVSFIMFQVFGLPIAGLFLLLALAVILMQTLLTKIALVSETLVMTGRRR